MVSNTGQRKLNSDSKKGLYMLYDVSCYLYALGVIYLM